MIIRSLGYQTDLIFPAFDGEIIQRDSYLVIRTPANPGFFWGNFLLFDHPPRAGDEPLWAALFAQEIGSPTQVNHQAFGWDVTGDDPGELQDFLQNGYRLNHSVVLSAQQAQSPIRLAPPVQIRPLESDDEWEQVVELQVLCREPEFNEANYRVFRQRQMPRYRRMSQAGLGAWFGAFTGGQMVADLGVYHNGVLGRFQSVETHPDFRRQGIAGWLVYQASLYALSNFPIQRLVIVADADSAPARLYQSLGYQFTEFMWGLEKWKDA